MRNLKNAENSMKDSTLYVGSKHGRLGTRVNQHLGTANDRTYALHIDRWMPQESMTLRVVYYLFKDDVTSRQLQFIEDSLWDFYKPLFGKRGAH